MAGRWSHSASSAFRSCVFTFGVVALIVTRPQPVRADIVNGLMRIVGGVLEVPKDILAGTFSGPPIVGTVAGALAGALRGTAMVASGALETVVSAIPVAAKLAPYIPVFF